MMNGEMKEAQERAVDCPDIEPATFACFGKWLYTGDYTVHQPGQSRFRCPSLQSVPWDHGLSPKEKKRKEREMKLNGTWDNRTTEDDATASSIWSPSHVVLSSKSKKQKLWDHFTSTTNYRPAAPPRTNALADYPNVTDELILHAKLYCFADKYAIPTLRSLCLEKLKLSLIDCECQRDQIRGIVELLVVTANNTPPLTDSESGSLRSVVLSFTIFIFESLAEDGIFQDLLADGGSIVTEMVSQLVHRLD